jgi:hypothetical protein
MADRRKVNPDLVSPSGLEPTFQTARLGGIAIFVSTRYLVRADLPSTTTAIRIGAVVVRSGHR